MPAWEVRVVFGGNDMHPAPMSPNPRLGWHALPRVLILGCVRPEKRTLPSGVLSFGAKTKHEVSDPLRF